MKPRRRRESLLVTEVEDETILYDLERHKAHCLNPTAAFVWSLCDGETSIPEMTRRLRDRLGAPVGDEWVLRALDQLRKARLLDANEEPTAGRGLTRRELLRTSSVAAALLPIVVSLVAPTPAIAGFTCTPPNCIASSACRPGIDTCHCCGPPNCVKKCDANGNCSNAVSGC